jgi:hypothetical protein
MEPEVLLPCSQEPAIEHHIISWTVQIMELIIM